MPERETMGRRLRWLPALLLPVLLAAPAGAQTSAATAPRASLQQLAAPAPLARPGQSVTQLPDGRWLLLGGQGVDQEAVASAELLDAATGKREKLGAKLLQARRGHSATLLPDGSVLLLGGVDSAGNAVAQAERFDPQQGRFEVLPALPLLQRSGHSATVLADGRLLIAGGADGRGRPLYEAEIFDPATRQVERFNPKLESARMHHLAALLPSAEVLLWAGSDGEARRAEGGELYDAASQRFSSVSAAGLDELAARLAAPAPLALAGSRPEAEAHAAPVDQAIVLRFNQAMDVRSLNGASVTLLGPHGTVALKVVPVEQGLLAFVKPTADLLPDSRYTLFIDGARSRAGVPLGFTSLGFSTARLDGRAGGGAAVGGADGAPVSYPVAPGAASDASRSSATGLAGANAGAGAGADAAVPQAASRQYGALEAKAMADAASIIQSEIWQPDATALKGDWRAKRGESPMQKLPPLQAPPGETALAGQVLTMHGRGLPNVRLRIGEQQALSDDTGRFLLRGITAGVQVLTIDGSAADKEATRYGYYQVRVDVHQGKTTALDYTIWSSRLDPAGTVAIASPNEREVVLTSPRIPGLELRIPAGSVIRDSNGKIVTELNMTAIPVDRPPFPLPNVGVPVYFTVQPGGAAITSTNTRSQQGARLIYPNFSGAAPGSRVDFWNYDARGKGWYVYGQGTISPDGKQAIPDADVKIYEFTGAMISVPSNGPPEGPPPGGCGAGGGGGGCNSDSNQPPQPSGCAGDPVDCATGLFLSAATDLSVADVIPLQVARSYRPRDPASRAFGIGTNLSYDFFLVGDTSPWTYQELILPDGGRLRFKRISAGTSYTDAVYQHTSSTTRYYGAILRYKGGNCYWELKLKDGEIVCFPESMNSTVARAAAATSLSDRYGNTLTFTRSSNNLTRVASPSGRYIDFTYDAKNRITQAIDNAGRTVGYEYDAAGHLVKVTDPLGQTEVFTYDAAHNMLTVQDKRGNLMVSNVYDANNRVSKQTYADGSTNLFSYTLNAAGKVVQTEVTNERGIVKRIEFNEAGYPLRITNAVGQPEQQAETYEREPLSHLLLSRTDALGRKTAYTYDALGNMLTQTLFAGTPAAVTTTFTYNGLSQLLSQSDTPGQSTSWSYDGQGNLVEVKDVNGNSVRYAYNGAGQPVEVKDGRGRSTLLAYDGYDLASVTDPLNRSTSMVTDAVGRTRAVADALGNRTEFDTDALGRITRTTNALGDSTVLGYDGNNNGTSVTDARQNQYKFGFGKRNSLDGSSNPLLQDEGFVYDGARNLIQSTDRKGQVTRYSYDSLNRVKTVTYADNSTVDYSYDAADRVTRVADSLNGVITRSYDGYNNITEESTPRGTVSYTYDAQGRRKTMTLPGQPAISYNYDAGGRLTGIEQAAAPANGNQAVKLSFGYDANNRRTRIVYANGIVRSNSFDDAGQLESISYSKADGSVVGDLTYTYDAAGRRTGAGGSLARPLAPAEITASTVDAANRLTALNGQTLSYDANGNLLSDGSRSYVWNARDQLVQIKAADGTVLASFAYDAFGRRQSKVVDGVASAYVYDGLNIVQELNAVNASNGTPASVRASYLVGGIDEVFARTSGSGVLSYLSDALGSVVRLADAQGNKVVDYSYDPYGVTVADVAHGNPFQYTGRENDGSTGLYYYRARYYAPAMARFVQSDPIGLDGGINAYAYVNGNPLSLSDPYGLWSAADLPSIPQPVVDFAAGFGDTLSFGLTDWIRDQMGTNGAVDKCSMSYTGGEVAGVALSTAMGGAAGLRAAGTRGAGKEFSHWIPNRMGGPRSLWNGNYVTTAKHALSDPYRYRFMPRSWKAQNPMPSRFNQQWVRIPNVYKGGAAGAAAGGAGAAANGGDCGCD